MKKWWQYKNNPDWRILLRDKVTGTVKAEYFRTLKEAKRMAKAWKVEMWIYPDQKTIEFWE